MDNIVTLLPFIVLIGAMFLMTRSAKRKQRQASDMRASMQPGTGVRTIGGLYGTVKEVRDDAVLLEVAPGVHTLFAKNAVGAVLEQAEYDRITNDGPVVPDDASSLTDGDSAAVSSDDEPADSKPDFTKSESDADTPAEPESSQDAAESKDTKRDGDSDSK